jgi:transposase
VAILLADEGMNNQEIAESVETSRHWVQKWRKRFAQSEVKPPPPGQEASPLVQLPALDDLPRSGRPPVFSPQARHVVVSVACQAGRERDFSGVSHDSVRDLAQLVAGRGAVIAMSPATVQRIVAEMVLKPHRVRDWLTRTDPEFERKMDEIVKLYLAPPRNSRRLCIDEKTGIQALERRYPTVPRRPGQIERREFEYIRHRVVDLFAAFDVRTGQVFGQCYKHHSNVEFRHFLHGLRAYDPDRRGHLILDNASYHSKPEGLEWCAVQRPTITLHGLPSPGSWLNQVESWFSILSRKCLRRASVGSTREWRDVLHRFMDTWNAPFAHPRQWTYTGKPLVVSHQQFDLAAV